MDLVSISIILGAVIAGAAGIQHFYDRYSPRGLYSRTLRTSKEGLEALQSELGAVKGVLVTTLGALTDPGEVSQDPLGLEALKSNFMDLPNKIQVALHTELELAAQALDSGIKALPAQMEGAMTRALTEATKIALKDPSLMADEAPVGMDAVQPMGVDAAAERKLTRSLKAAVGSDALGPYGAILEQFAPTTFSWLREHPEMVMWALEQPWLRSIIQRASSMVAQATGGSNASVSSTWGT